MVRWITLLSFLVVSAMLIGFVELEPAIEWIVKLVYFSTLILVVISLLLRDIQGKQVE